jgi:tetratricopeptide (TPR) repeat protein
VKQIRWCVASWFCVVFGGFDLCAQEAAPPVPATAAPAQDQAATSKTPAENAADGTVGQEVKVPDDVRLAMEELNNAFGSGSTRRIGQKFPLGALFESLVERQLIPALDEAEQTKVLERLETAMRSRYRSFAELAWSEVKWNRFERIDEQRVVIMGRHYDAAEASTNVYWWLKREGEHWKVYDLEIVDMNMRFSAMVGAGYSMAGRPLKSLQAFQELADSAEILNSGMMDEDDLEALIENADAVMDDEFPVDIKRFALFLRAVALTQLNETDAALEDLNALEKLPGESPVLYRLRGEILVAEERFEAAIESFEKLGEKLGFDVGVHESISDAYLALGKYEPAADHARRGLQDMPESMGCLASLAAALPASKVEELEPFFKDHDYDEDVLVMVVMWCVEADRMAGAKFAYKALKKHHPNNEILEEFREELDSNDH